MTSISRRALSLLCALTLASSLVPVSAFAETPARVDCVENRSVLSLESGEEPAALGHGTVDRFVKHDIRDAVLEETGSGVSSAFANDGDEVPGQIRATYDLICEKAAKLETTISLEGRSITVAELKDAMDLVLCNPELWWLGLSYSYSYVSSSNIPVDECQAAAVKLSYIYSPEEVTALAPEVEDSIQEALSWIGPDMNDFQKAQVLHDYLVRTCQYSLEVAGGGDSQISYHRAVSALAGNKVTVCQGYALAYKWLLKEAGVDAVYVASEEMHHGWNMVNIDGKWYHVDVTWDDPVMIRYGTSEKYNEGFDADVRHTYFLKSDSTFRSMKDAHTGWATSLEAPDDYPIITYPEYKAPFVYDCSVNGHRTAGEHKENNKLPTCTEAGSFDWVVRCLACGEKVSARTESVAALGHSYGNYSYNNDAQVGVDGTETATCSRCGKEVTRTALGTALKPAPSTPDVKPTPSPSVAAPPSSGSSSSSKGRVPAPSKGQTVVVGAATFTATGASTVAYAGPASKAATSAAVPATVKVSGRTYKVTSVSAKAFAGNKKLKSVKIGANVTAIPAGAFKGCTALASVSFGANVRTIGKQAFCGCKALKSVTLGARVVSIGAGAFQNCGKLAKVTVRSASLKTVGASAFAGCRALKSVTLSSAKLTAIGASAFSGCAKLRAVTLKTTKLKSVGKNALKGTTKALSVKVPKSKVKAYQKLFKGKGSKTLVVKK